MSTLNRITIDELILQKKEVETSIHKLVCKHEQLDQKIDQYEKVVFILKELKTITLLDVKTESEYKMFDHNLTQSIADRNILRQNIAELILQKKQIKKSTSELQKMTLDTLVHQISDETLENVHQASVRKMYAAIATAKVNKKRKRNDLKPIESKEVVYRHGKYLLTFDTITAADCERYASLSVSMILASMSKPYSERKNVHWPLGNYMKPDPPLANHIVMYSPNIIVAAWLYHTQVGITCEEKQFDGLIAGASKCLISNLQNGANEYKHISLHGVDNFMYLAQLSGLYHSIQSGEYSKLSETDLQNFEGSHLCGNPGCVLHVVYESHEMNMSRNSCIGNIVDPNMLESSACEHTHKCMKVKTTKFVTSPCKVLLRDKTIIIPQPASPNHGIFQQKNGSWTAYFYQGKSRRTIGTFGTDKNKAKSAYKIVCDIMNADGNTRTFESAKAEVIKEVKKSFL